MAETSGDVPHLTTPESARSALQTVCMCFPESQRWRESNWVDSTPPGRCLDRSHSPEVTGWLRDKKKWMNLPQKGDDNASEQKLVSRKDSSSLNTGRDIHTHLDNRHIAETEDPLLRVTEPKYNYLVSGIYTCRKQNLQEHSQDRHISDEHQYDTMNNIWLDLYQWWNSLHRGLLNSSHKLSSSLMTWLRGVHASSFACCKILLLPTVKQLRLFYQQNTVKELIFLIVHFRQILSHLPPILRILIRSKQLLGNNIHSQIKKTWVIVVGFAEKRKDRFDNMLSDILSVNLPPLSYR